MPTRSGWTERATHYESVRIFDHASGYVVLGIMEDDRHRRWDVAKGRGRLSRIVSEHPFESLFEAIEEAERRLAADDRLAVEGRGQILCAG